MVNIIKKITNNKLGSGKKTSLEIILIILIILFLCFFIFKYFNINKYERFADSIKIDSEEPDKCPKCPPQKECPPRRKCPPEKKCEEKECPKCREYKKLFKIKIIEEE